MQQQATQAYQQTGRQTAAPRDLEANLLSMSATHLQRVRDDWAGGHDGLLPALHFNRKLWTVFLTSVTGDESTLPRDLRENVANLGLFVMKQTINIQAAPLPQKLDVLININRQLALGLRATPPA